MTRRPYKGIRGGRPYRAGHTITRTPDEIAADVAAHDAWLAEQRDLSTWSDADLIGTAADRCVAAPTRAAARAELLRRGIE